MKQIMKNISKTLNIEMSHTHTAIMNHVILTLVQNHSLKLKTKSILLQKVNWNRKSTFQTSKVTAQHTSNFIGSLWKSFINSNLPHFSWLEEIENPLSSPETSFQSLKIILLSWSTIQLIKVLFMSQYCEQLGLAANQFDLAPIGCKSKFHVIF